VLARACLAALLRLEHHPSQKSYHRLPLAQYAAGNLPKHADFGNVISHIGDGLDILLDIKKPHLKIWLRVLDDYGILWSCGHQQRAQAIPLFHVAELGFHGIAQHLISKCPQSVNVCMDYHGTPLHAAVRGGSTEVTKLLLQYCEDMDVRDDGNMTLLHLASALGHLDTVQLLLDHDGHKNDRRGKGTTPLLRIASSRPVTFARMLLIRKTGIHARDKDGYTPLHLASLYSHPDVVKLLLSRGAVSCECPG
jgi:Ankyrin repeats (3 copies)/Ankyrin repeat